MADTTSKRVQEYKESLKTKAEELILKGFPETIVKLNDILETPQFRNREFADVHQELNIPIPDPIILNSHSDLPPAKKTKFDNSISQDGISQDGTKVLILPSGAVRSNKNLMELVDIVKPHIRKLVEDSNLVSKYIYKHFYLDFIDYLRYSNMRLDNVDYDIVKPHIRKLVEDSNLLKMWISFMIPKIEDGNNFGVSIQEDTLAEVQSVESEAAAFYDQISRYFISRGKLISKVAKYPHIDDYRRAVQEMDEKEYLSLWLVMAEIRNRYCSLHDIVVKNLDKIKKPRSTNATESLY